MSGSTIGIGFIVVIVLAGLILWLAMVARAARHPHQEHPQRDPLHGIVQGGQHVGGGRSVAPHRTAPVPEGGGNPPTPEEEEAVYGARQSVDDRGNPLDL
jgi:hypothetical protein